MRIKFLFLLFIACKSLVAQETDSIYYQLQEVEVRPRTMQSSLRLTTSENILGSPVLGLQPPASILPAMNTVAGVRMEERSPGSYRLSIRGSLLRSPFGVRNVKIYLWDFPFTDAGGNSYLNSLDLANIGSIRIIKGPEGSIFGANTGGVVLIDPVYKSDDSLHIIVSASAGSFGLRQQHTALRMILKKSVFALKTGYLSSEGYRTNSAMKRYFLQATNSWSYSSKASLKALFLFSDLDYRTPGGLTLEQFIADPSAARPPTNTLPGATQQKAGVKNRTLFAGISHELALGNNLTHLVSVFGSSTRFANPFITNYEERQEHSFGIRSYLEWQLKNTGKLHLRWNGGVEWQQSDATISNYANRSGEKDTLQAADILKAQQGLIFTRLLADIGQRMLAEVSVSYNTFRYHYKSRDSFDFNTIRFRPEWMPRVAVSYLLTNRLSARASAGMGYSNPTIAEVRSSDNQVNTALKAETGQNYEVGLRFKGKNDRYFIDACFFWFSLHNAILRRLNADGTEYFINGGSTRQPGLELSGEWQVILPRTKGFIRGLQLTSSIAYNRFTFRNYVVNSGNDYSGKRLTGVPSQTVSAAANLQLPGNLTFYTQYYYCSELPLDDANRSFAGDYHLLRARLEWTRQWKNHSLGIFTGADNLLNQVYSLGNDLNAVGGRYYNAAAPRNYYGGIRISL